MDQSMRAKIGVEEPLDGILIGAASGGGFAIVETLGQYVSNYLSDIFLRVGLAQYKIVGDDAIKAGGAAFHVAQLVKVIQDGANMVGTSPATGDLITRSLDLSFGHMAYSGYFGYFIWFSIIKPDHRWKILSIGLVSAAIPHALWDTFAFKDMTLVMGLTAILAYAILAAAILKAREISPNRSILQPSVIFGMEPAVAVAASNVPVAVRMAPFQVAVPPMQEVVPALKAAARFGQPSARRNQVSDHCSRPAPARTPGPGLGGEKTAAALWPKSPVIPPIRPCLASRICRPPRGRP